jgi:hypothetical protein
LRFQRSGLDVCFWHLTSPHGEPNHWPKSRDKSKEFIPEPPASPADSGCCDTASLLSLHHRHYRSLVQPFLHLRCHDSRAQNGAFEPFGKPQTRYIEQAPGTLEVSV